MFTVTRAGPGAVLAAALALVAAVAPGPARGDAAREEGPKAESASTAEVARPRPRAEEPALGEEIVVTATRSPQSLRDLPAQVTVVGRAEIERSPGKTVDEVLRAVPAFNTFRRSSSMGADPSAAGVSLRGVGPSAASRSLVLVDGIPANDAFGDNIWWRAIPPLGIQRIEIVPGGGSALYGNYAMGGVMQVLARPITPETVDVVVEQGSFSTGRLSAWASDRWGPVGAALEADAVDSGGYPVVAPAARGPIDAKASSRHAVASARLEAQAARDLILTGRGSFFYEDLNGGTHYTTAAVRRWEYATGARFTPGELGALELSLSGHVRDFLQDRARVNSSRSQEFLSGRQFVPASDLGASLVWRSKPLSLAGTHHLVLGADARWISGEAREGLFPAVVTPTTLVSQTGGGRQQLYGLFAEDLYDVSSAVSATLALRYDSWADRRGSRLEQLGDGSKTPTTYPSRSDGRLDPRVGLRVRAVEWLTLRAAGYAAYRSPNLDELYRSFQVGTVRTVGNPSLGPETLRGAEVGFALDVPRDLRLSATGFWNELKNPIANVTVGANQRQKQNLGQARIRGIEASAEWRFARLWTAGAAWIFVDSRVTGAPGNPQLIGKQLPQDPRYRSSLALAFDDPNLFTMSGQGSYVGRQYEDDVNALPMGEAFLVDLFVAWHLTRSLDLYGAVQNLLDRTYLVGRAGVDTVGQPRFIHAGIRVTTGG